MASSSSPFNLNSSCRKCSTAQVCLRRILHTIATCPDSPATDLAGGGNAASLGIDLALRLGSAGSGESDLTVEKSCEGGLEQSKASESGDCDDRRERSDFDGFLGMLVEAARWVSGGFGDGEGSEPEGHSHRSPARREEPEEEGGGEAAAAARRSERGRKRVMPGRYRDSVMEPDWKKRMSPPARWRRRRMSGQQRPRRFEAFSACKVAPALKKATALLGVYESTGAFVFVKLWH